MTETVGFVELRALRGLRGEHFRLLQEKTMQHWSVIAESYLSELALRFKIDPKMGAATWATKELRHLASLFLHPRMLHPLHLILEVGMLH